MGDKLKAFWTKVNSEIKDLWNKDKAFLFTFGFLILVVKFRDLMISVLVNSGKRVEDKSQKQSDVLTTQENQANQQANQLTQQAQDLPQTETPVTEDWYKKDPNEKAN